MDDIIYTTCRSVANATGLSSNSCRRSDPTYYATPMNIVFDEVDGWIVTAIDLPGCMSDGSTLIEAIENLQFAISEWCCASVRLGRRIPDLTQR